MKNDIRPFPFHSLESVSRFEVDAKPGLRRFFASRVDLDRVLGVAGDLLSASLRAHLRAVSPVPFDGAERASDLAFVLAPAGGAAPFLVTVEAALAARAVARVMKRPEPRIVNASLVAASADLAGAFAAVLWTVARRAHRSSPLRVVDAGSHAAVMPRFLEMNAALGGVSAMELTVLFDDEAYLVTVTAPRAATVLAGRSPLGTAGLRAMGLLPLSLPVVLACLRLPSRELSQLAVGDAVILGADPATPRLGGLGIGGVGGGSEGSLANVVLAASRGEHGVSARLESGTRVVVGQELVSLFWKEEDTPMVDSQSARATTVALEDVPVLVRVELGAVEMAASAWAEISPGDVVALGRAPSDPVALRVAGVEIARGELVMVDGEVGVRIVEIRK